MKKFLILLLVLPTSILSASIQGLQGNGSCSSRHIRCGCKNGMAQGKGTAREQTHTWGFSKMDFLMARGFTPGHRAINTMGNGIWVCGKEKGLLQEPLVGETL